MSEGQTTAEVQTMAEARATTVRSLAILAIFPLGALLIRLAISDAFLYDEAEQYLLSNDLKAGYPDQPPLFNWAVFAISRLLGMGLPAIALVKYACLFLMYAGLYATARRLFPLSPRPGSPDIALVVAGSALLIPHFSLKIIADLTHTVMMLAVTAWTAFAFLRLLGERRRRDYVGLGILFGLGMLSKYNYVFPAAALTGAALWCRQHRGALLTPRFLLTIICALAVFAPHGLWLIQEGFQPVTYVVERGRLGGLAIAELLGTVFQSYWQGALYALLVVLTFGWQVGPASPAGERFHPFIRRSAGLALALPVVSIVSVRLGFFKAKWLTASLLLLPLGLFASARPDLLRRRAVRFGRGVALFAALVLAMRALVGFAPDVTRSGGRELIPYARLSPRLESLVEARGWNPAETLLVTRTPMLAANLLQRTAFQRYVVVKETPTPEQQRLIAAVPHALLVWDGRDQAESRLPGDLQRLYPQARLEQPLQEPYLRSKRKQYVLAAALAQAADDRPPDR
jgi:4-amino-4-deoxy-L-arabinose transferase-like glycosyltransferase